MKAIFPFCLATLLFGSCNKDSGYSFLPGEQAPARPRAAMPADFISSYNVYYEAKWQPQPSVWATGYSNHEFHFDYLEASEHPFIFSWYRTLQYQDTLFRAAKGSFIQILPDTLRLDSQVLIDNKFVFRVVPPSHIYQPFFIKWSLYEFF